MAEAAATGQPEVQEEIESPARGPARSFMDALYDFNGSSLRHVAGYIRECHSDDEIEGLDTLIEYCLFASHRDTGLPMLARMAYRRQGYYRYFKEIVTVVRSEMDQEIVKKRRELLMEIMCSYAEAHPGIIPATAFFFLLQLRDYLEPGVQEHPENVNFRTALTRCGEHWAPADAVDELGDSQLTAALVRVVFCSPATLRVFLDRVPGARNAVDMQHPVDGSTPAHLCVRLNLMDRIQVLVEYGADLTIKDQKGRTALDLARIYGNYDAVAQHLANANAPQPGNPAGVAPFLSSSTMRVGKFPKIFLPSAPDLHPSKTNEILMEYLRCELPQLLSMDPSLVVVPPIVDTYSYPTGSPGEKGDNSEMKVLKTVVAALRKFVPQDNKDGLHVACFHDLRYGCPLPHCGQWESDFDIAILCFQENTGAHALFLFEIKSITRAKDVVRSTGKSVSVEKETTGTHALDQLCTHVLTLEDHIGIDVSPDWVIPCLALPLFPTSGVKTGKNSKKTPDEEKLGLSWDDFIDKSVISKDPRVAGYSKILPQLLTRFHLDNPDNMHNWFKGVFESVSETSASLDSNEREKRKDAYSTVLAWCITHCMGIGVQQVSRVIDKEGGEVMEESLALLTLEQKKAFQLTPSSDSMPLLIVGAAGTGKTLLGVQKLIKCEKDGLMSENRRGLFLTHCYNRGLLSQVRKQLEASSSRYIQARAFGKDVLADLSSIPGSNTYSFIVIDQLEDMYIGMNSKSKDVLIPTIMTMNCFDMFWVLVNPFDIPEMDCEELLVNLSSLEVYGRTIHLHTRIRNTTEIGKLVDTELLRTVWSLPLHFASQPATWTSTAANGVPVFAEYYEEGGGEAELAQVLHHLLLDTSVKDKDLAVVHINDDRSFGVPTRMDKYLMEEFCKPNNRRVPSTAPLLVRAAWVGDIKDSLAQRDLDEAQEWYQAQFMGLEEPYDGPQVYERARVLLQRYAFQLTKEWTEMSADLRWNSVALHAIMSLVIRFADWAFKEGDHSFLLELVRAIKVESADNSKLRDLIVRHRCVSMLNSSEIGGYEGDVVVVFWQLDHSFIGSVLMPGHHFMMSGLRSEIPRSLARAKVMAVLMASSCIKEKLERFVGPLKFLIEK